MKLAIITLSKNSVETGRKLHRLLEESDLYIPAKFGPNSSEELPFDTPVSELIEDIFHKYDNLIFIMASGIAIRAVAPLLQGKQKDPGVLLMDEKEENVVSLLGGHSKRNNALACRIAGLIGANPVITTASDVEGFPAVDLLGQQYGWNLESSDNMTRVMAAIVNGDSVGLYQDTGEIDFGKERFPENVTEYDSLEELVRSDCQAAILITDRILDERFEALLTKSILYRPKSLVIGMGFNSGTMAEEMESAITGVLEIEGLSSASVCNLATIDLKSSDAQLKGLSQKRGWEIQSYTVEQLKSTPFPSEASESVLKAVGTPAVAEPAAILSSRNTKLILPKTKLGNVTISVARILHESRGKLYIVGTGPGDMAQLTIEAWDALADCDTIVGYKTYIRLLGSLVKGKEVIESGMRHELDRAREAMDIAATGKKVALVSGGDPGIYGMSAPVFEAMSGQEAQNFDIEIIPGIPAFSASAAILGAPLSQDVAIISLSNLLTPWELIVKRLEKAAEADFIIAVYNPKSKGRPDQFIKAIDIILQHRPKETPVGLVKNAYRETQSSVVTDLADISEMDIDMSSMIIIGNSLTKAMGGWMITPRGYRAKYGW